MFYTEVISLLKQIPDVKFKRQIWPNAYIIKDPNNRDNIIYHRSTMIDNTLIETDQKYYPCMSDIVADDWEEYICI